MKGVNYMANYKYELQCRDCKYTWINVREEVKGVNAGAINAQAIKVNNDSGCPMCYKTNISLRKKLRIY